MFYMVFHAVSLLHLCLGIVYGNVIFFGKVLFLVTKCLFLDVAVVLDVAVHS